MKATKRILSRTEIIRAHEILKEHLIKRDNGEYEYINGHSDISVAGLVASDIRGVQIAKLRLELFGKLADRATSTEITLARLEARVAYLEQQLGVKPKY